MAKRIKGVDIHVEGLVSEKDGDIMLTERKEIEKVKT